MNSCSGIMSAVICVLSLAGWLQKLAEALAPPSRQHRTTAPFCSPLFIRFHTGRSSLLVRTQMFLFLHHFQIFICSHFSRVFTFPLCISPSCAQDVYAMTLAQWKYCSHLDIFMVHFGAALLSFLDFLVASKTNNTMGMFGGFFCFFVFKKRLYLDS